MVDYDADDVLPPKKRRWINEAQRAIFWATLPTNLAWLVVYLIAFSVLSYIKGG